MRFFWCSSLSLLFLGCLSAHAQVKRGTVAFLGDSISTGAVTHPALTYDDIHLWNILRGREDVSPKLEFVKEMSQDFAPQNLDAPRRLWPSKREYVDAFNWIGLNFINSLSRVYLDTEEYSWSYLLARKMGYEPQNILMAGQDGARMKDAIYQMDRVLDATGGDVPEKLFVFFTGNDLCGPSLNFVTSNLEFKGQLDLLLKYIARNGKTPEGGTDIYIVSFLGITQLTSSPDIINKELSAFGKKTTCGELAAENVGPSAGATNEFLKKDPTAAAFLSFFPKSPAAMCATVFDKNIDWDPDQKGMLANRIRAFRESSLTSIKEFSERQASRKQGNFRVHFLADTGELMFRADDIANDCFHLSLKGQTRVAQAVETSLGKL